MTASTVLAGGKPSPAAFKTVIQKHSTARTQVASRAVALIALPCC
jgi:hypothetical protein